ncbi:MAG TPA: large-conductance mechanosensitive channel protein MscL [Syntrophomonadaceae bacterium]|nr:large-conductance mechanosensitive channel protein MscL [Syntrophomonadaceae bacterium]HQE23573.1 large-conductance mechanosensitive channel protein MscL [Syntrophomonadaceae bacterium]
MWQEFKEFAIKGNVLDLAIAVIIGGAFGKIVSSLVSDIIMPLIGLLLGGLDFSGLKIQVGDEQILYGMFIQNVVDFFVIALAIFVFVKAISKMKKPVEEPEPEPVPSNTEILLMEIRDLLKRTQ